jgi:hypothetical protein
MTPEITASHFNIFIEQILSLNHEEYLLLISKIINNIARVNIPAGTGNYHAGFKITLIIQELMPVKIKQPAGKECFSNRLLKVNQSGSKAGLP